MGSNPNHKDFDAIGDHTPLNLMFQFGKFCTMRGLPPPTVDEYREMLTEEGFTKEEIDAALSPSD